MTGFEERFAPPPRFADASGELHDLVARELGSDDFGPDDYLPGLKVLLLSMDYDPRFSERGRRIAWGEVFSALYARAHSAKAMKGREKGTAKREKSDGRYPVPGSRFPQSPIVITGIPRTGTTALHKLMAVDPQFQGLQTWLTGAPMPRPPRETWGADPQFRKMVDALERRYAATPDKRAAHLMAADEVDECCLVLRQSFVSNLWACGWTATSYDLWRRTQSERRAYEHLRRVLQLIGGDEPKRWLLKNPGHIAALDDLFAVLPDAMVIQTHRDPAKAVPSLCALLIRSHDVMEEGRRDLRARLMASRETETWAKAVRDAEPVREAHQGQILDIVHADFHRAPMETIERIYAFASLELAPATRAAMKERIADDPERKHGPHRYDIADFGMTEDDIRARFGDYVERFDLVPRG